LHPEECICSNYVHTGLFIPHEACLRCTTVIDKLNAEYCLVKGTIDQHRDIRTTAWEHYTCPINRRWPFRNIAPYCVWYACTHTPAIRRHRLWRIVWRECATTLKLGAGNKSSEADGGSLGLVAPEECICRTISTPGYLSLMMRVCAAYHGQ
jgi:hypothetical protein